MKLNKYVANKSKEGMRQLEHWKSASHQVWQKKVFLKLKIYFKVWRNSKKETIKLDLNYKRFQNRLFPKLRKLKNY